MVFRRLPRSGAVYVIAGQRAKGRNVLQSHDTRLRLITARMLTFHDFYVGCQPMSLTEYAQVRIAFWLPFTYARMQVAYRERFPARSL